MEHEWGILEPWTARQKKSCAINVCSCELHKTLSYLIRCCSESSWNPAPPFTNAIHHAHGPVPEGVWITVQFFSYCLQSFFVLKTRAYDGIYSLYSEDLGVRLVSGESRYFGIT